jgi:hypothetical protein
MIPNPDPELEDELADDIAIENPSVGGDGPDEASDNADETEGDDEAAEMEEVQRDAAEERKEGGYQ